MYGEKKWAETLINTVLSEFKVCEGEMKLITCNNEVKFKKLHLVYPDEKQRVHSGLHDPSDDSRNQNRSHFCKIKYETLLILTSI
jgi:tRNA U34 2-thiouridine synthase MnmA/TrmU